MRQKAKSLPGAKPQDVDHALHCTLPQPGKRGERGMLRASLIITLATLMPGTAVAQSSDAITLLQREAVEDLQCRPWYTVD
jgi:hypothetical protein